MDGLCRNQNVRNSTEKNMMNNLGKSVAAVLAVLFVTGCTVKAVGDPDRPITINANVVVDIRGLQQTANNIEDMVAKGG